MSDYDKNLREPGNQNRVLAPARSSTSWIAAAVIALLLLAAISYVFSNRMVSNGVVEHRAAATDPATPDTAVKPMTAPSAVPATPDSATKP